MDAESGTTAESSWGPRGHKAVMLRSKCYAGLSLRDDEPRSSPVGILEFDLKSD